MNKETFGLALILSTAIISGFSIFINKFAVSQSNPFILTFAKSIIVSALLFSVLLLFRDFGKLRLLSKIQWLKLSLVGLIGGSTAFLIYFYALKQTSAINAGFIHKTLFIFAAIFAVFFLKEKISKSFLAGAILLLAGNYFLFSKFSAFNIFDLMILAAVVLWAAENALSKHLLSDLSGGIVAFGRMFFGSIFLLIFLAFAGQLTLQNFTFSGNGLFWILITSLLLFLYNLSYYSGLKHIPLHKAAAILMLGQPITTLLAVTFSTAKITPELVFGNLLLAAGCALIIGFSFILSKFNQDRLTYKAKS